MPVCHIPSTEWAQQKHSPLRQNSACDINWTVVGQPRPAVCAHLCSGPRLSSWALGLLPSPCSSFSSTFSPLSRVPRFGSLGHTWAVFLPAMTRPPSPAWTRGAPQTCKDILVLPTPAAICGGLTGMMVVGSPASILMSPGCNASCENWAQIELWEWLV